MRVKSSHGAAPAGTSSSLLQMGYNHHNLAKVVVVMWKMMMKRKLWKSSIFGGTLEQVQLGLSKEIEICRLQINVPHPLRQDHTILSNRGTTH